MSARLRVALLPLYVLLLALPAAPARGQAFGDSTSVGGAGRTTAPGVAGPTLRSLSVGARPQLATADSADLLAQQRRGAGLGQSEALMIVGGAAVLLGALVGDDPGKVIMVGGAVIFLYGFYKYLQQ